jgi:hypothetical protein
MASSSSSSIPALQLPKSSCTVTVRVIDTTAYLYLPVGTALQPNYEGHTDFVTPSYSFLIEHEYQTQQHQLQGDQHDSSRKTKTRRVLFDLGVQKDWQNLPPSTLDMIKEFEWDVKVEKDVAEILEENKVETGSVEAIIWRYIIIPTLFFFNSLCG